LASLLCDISTVLRVNHKVKCLNIHVESVFTIVSDLVSDVDGTVIVVEHVQNTSNVASSIVHIEFLSNVCDDVSSHHGRLIEAITVRASLRSLLGNHADGASEVVINKINSTHGVAGKPFIRVAVHNVPSVLIPFVIILASVPEVAKVFFDATVLVAHLLPALVFTAVGFSVSALTPVALPPGPALTIIEDSVLVIGKEFEGTFFLVVRSKFEGISFELVIPKISTVDLSDSFITGGISKPGKLRGTCVPANVTSFTIVTINKDFLALPEATVPLLQHTSVNWGLAAHLCASRGCNSSKNEKSVRHNIY